ncbi:MAG TPA: hypothetical protein VJU77_17720 [Chthoniobacterales bacterium]|nr:hypothetical protein [Chthoniobacterales bacterium]
MRRALGLFAVAACLSLATARAQIAAEIVVAIRYLQSEGESHSHLFLYREDGTLVRQLTNEERGQDTDPMFADDGQTIVFTREIAENQSEQWSIEPSGDGLKRLGAAPHWYLDGPASTYFVWPEMEGSGDDESAPGFGSRTQKFRAPDGSVELILKEVRGDENDSVNGPEHGKHYVLRDLKSGKSTEFPKIPGFEGAVEQLESKGPKPTRFLFDPPLRLAFFGVHLNSTDGDTDYALDLTKRRFVRLSPNWAAPFPLPGDGAFLTMTYNRYVPIPNSTKTANCSYLERWDSNLNKIRFAKEGSAAVCYGAAMYRPGKTPAVINIFRSAD